MKKIFPKSNLRIRLPLLGVGALLVEQAVASFRSSIDNHTLDLSEVSIALDHISSDQSAASAAEFSEQLAALNALVQTELSLVSGDLDSLSIGLNDGLDLVASEKQFTETFARDGSSDEGLANPTLVAQLDASSGTQTDQPNPVLAQLSQSTPQQPTQSSTVSKAAEETVSSGDGDGFNWSLIGGGLVGLALVSGAGGSAPSDTTAPTANITISDKILTAGEQTTITITFSELVKNFELSDLNAQNGVLSDLIQSSNNPLIWTAKFVPATSTEDLTNVIRLSGEFTDSAGNLGVTAASDNYIVATKLAGGTVADGYIDGAIVFRDLNGDGIQGEGEDAVLTGPGGVFSGLGGYGGTIVAFGGTDISTGLSFAGVLKAPAGAAVINPLTTLVAAVTGDTTGKSPSEIASMVSAAELKVASLLGIDPSLGPITQIDPIALIAAGGAGAQAALQMQLAAIQVANLLVTLSQSIVNSGVSANANDASLLMSDALASLVNSISANGTLDLSSASVINGLFSSVVSSAAESGIVSADSLAELQQVAGQAANALAAVNTQIDAIDLSTGIQGLTYAVAAQLVIVGDNGLLNALSSGQAFNTDNLAQLINDNLDDVKDVVAPTTAPTGEPIGDGIWDISNATDLDRPDSDIEVTENGTVNLDTSLSALSAMGIDTITGNDGTSVLIQGGIGGLDLDLTDLRFTDGGNGETDLDVTLQTDLADIADIGTGNLSTNLSALANMGIDTINLNNSLNDLAGLGVISGETGTSLVIQGGIDGFDLDATDLRFTDGGGDPTDLDVTLDVTDDIENGTVNLSTNLSALSEMGIDTITGTTGTFVSIQDFTWSELLDLGLNFTDGGADGSDLFVHLDLTVADASSMLDTQGAAENLRDMGIDFINNQDIDELI